MQNDTMRVIWAYHDEDPKVLSENSLAFSWHGANNRGAISVFLLDAPLAAPFPEDSEVLDPPIKHWDIYLHNVSFKFQLKPTTEFRANLTFLQASVNGEDSAYICKIIKAPKLDKKHHMIGVRTPDVPCLFKSKFYHEF